MWVTLRHGHWMVVDAQKAVILASLMHPVRLFDEDDAVWYDVVVA